MATRIALIHATPVALRPIHDAFMKLWPQAETTNLLDDSLSTDVSAAGEVTPDLTRRVVALARYAESLGAAGILYTCSAFGPAIDEAARGARIPVLKPNEAMLDDAVAAGMRVALIATFEPTLHSMQQELYAHARAKNVALEVTPVYVEGALEALHKGDASTHDRLIAEAAARVEACDVVVLAQFSMAQAKTAVAEAVSVPVVTSPESAVTRMRRLVESIADRGR